MKFSIFWEERRMSFLKKTFSLNCVLSVRRTKLHFLLYICKLRKEGKTDWKCGNNDFAVVKRNVIFERIEIYSHDNFHFVIKVKFFLFFSFFSFWFYFSLLYDNLYHEDANDIIFSKTDFLSQFFYFLFPGFFSLFNLSYFHSV
jgi:hypothetical protein